MTARGSSAEIAGTARARGRGSCGPRPLARGLSLVAPKSPPAAAPARGSARRASLSLCGVSTLLCCDFGLGAAKSDARDKTRGEVVLGRPDLAPRNAMFGEELCHVWEIARHDGSEQDCVRVGESGERWDGVRESGATREGDGSRFMTHECG